MNPIEEKLDIKRKELVQVTADQEARWKALKESETKHRTEHEYPWHAALKKQHAIQQEIAVLEAVLNELAVQ